jgi:hypothetical protein
LRSRRNEERLAGDAETGGFIVVPLGDPAARAEATQQIDPEDTALRSRA